MSATDLQKQIKYAIDRLAATIALILFGPLLLVIALAIKLGDGGPVLFTHERVGLGQRQFRIFKFRTMIVNADDLLDASGRVRSQDRNTRVGCFLRKTSLDEFPQLINILRGEMSLIGPRPVVPAHLPRYSPQQRRRFAMKPGITGFAQVSGRNLLPWSLRLKLDVEYVDGYSLWLDTKILFRTVIVVLSRDGMVMDRNPDHVDDLPAVYVPPDDESTNIAA